MKKKLTIVMLSLLFVLTMTACNNENTIDESKPTVVCTGFAQYDWVLNIIGDEAKDWNVIRINDKGADMHSYQPSAADMILINGADLLIYTGGMSEEWIEEVVESDDFEGKAYALLENENPIAIEDGHDHHEGHHHDAEEYDEHIWLSLEHAAHFCADIEVLLNDINPSKNYRANCESYIKKLDELGHQYEEALGCGEETHNHDHETEAIIFADRFPFRYLAKDYELAWYAAFPGCSAETEASFDTIKELSNKIEEMNVTVVFVTETGDDSLAKTVIENSGREDIEIIEVNSMQSIAKGYAGGYLDIMEDNLEALRKGLK